MILPEGFKRTNDSAKEEVEIPISDPPPTDVGANFVPISDLDEVIILIEIFIVFMQKHLPNLEDGEYRRQRKEEGREGASRMLP